MTGIDNAITSNKEQKPIESKPENKMKTLTNGNTAGTTGMRSPNNEKKEKDGVSGTLKNNQKDEDMIDGTKEEKEFLSAVPSCIVDFLNKSPTKIDTDYEYFQAILAVETSRILFHSLEDTTRQLYFRFSTFKESLNCETNNPILQCQTVGQAMEELHKQLDSKLQTYLESLQLEKNHCVPREEQENKESEISVEDEREPDTCTFIPLLENFLHALKATHAEKAIFRHLLVEQSGLLPPELDNLNAAGGGYRYSSMHISGKNPRNLHQLFRNIISFPGIMSLMNAESIWVKERLYYNNSHAGINVQFSRLTPETISAFVGLDVSLKQYNALQSSLLKKTLLLHPPFRTSAVGRSILMHKSRQKESSLVKAATSHSEYTNSNLLSAALSQGPKGDAGRNNAIDKGSPGSAECEVPKGANRKRDRLFEALSLSIKAENDTATKKAKFSKPSKNTKSEQEANEDSRGNDRDEDIEKEVRDEFGPYASDLAYLEHQVRLLNLSNRLRTSKRDLEKVSLNHDLDELDDGSASSRNLSYQNVRHHGGLNHQNGRAPLEQKVEKLQQHIQQLEATIAMKIASSHKENGKVFRLEQLCQALSLGVFEKNCILMLIKGAISPDGSPQQRTMNGTSSIGTLIHALCESLEEMMRCRKYFYKSSTIIEEGIITISQQGFMTDLTMCRVQLDRRLFDYIVGLDTEMSELVDGSHLYLPDVSVDDVVLPNETKKRIYDAVVNYEKAKGAIYEFEVDKKITYGLGQVLLFYGHSGTGKTMLANALAAKLGKKVLLVNFPDLGRNSSGSIIKFLFREARINRALLFFDECESLFRSRDKLGSTSVNMLLTELERFDGLCVLATNRAYDLDEAMFRRISLAVEFRKPDHMMRRKIWKILKPPKVPLEDDVDFALLSRKYELVGGTVKNSWLQAIHLMVQRGGHKVSQEDLMKAAGEQVLGQLSLEDFDRRVVPTSGVDKMILKSSIKDSLNSIVHYSKAQSVLFGQWGFDKIHRATTGISALFTGIPGTGKSMAAEAIGFDLGKPLLVVNAAELVSKWVGETGKNIDKVFAQAKKKDAVLVFDEAEGLFGGRSSGGSGASATSRHDNLNVGLLLQCIENFTGVCVVITNMRNAIDEAFFRRFRFVLNFEMPDAKDREQIWRTTIPKECPLSDDVDFSRVAAQYEMCGGSIKNALLRAATSAALRTEGESLITMGDLKEACDAEEQKMGDKHKMIGIYT